MPNLNIPRERFKKLFDATDGGGLEYDDFLEWLTDEIDELLEINDIEHEVCVS